MFKQHRSHNEDQDDLPIVFTGKNSPENVLVEGERSRFKDKEGGRQKERGREKEGEREKKRSPLKDE